MLTSNEESVLIVLNRGQKSISSIAKETGLSELEVWNATEKLKSLNFIEAGKK